MGHTTHGLALLPGYLDELAAGTMSKAGEPEVVRDTGPCLTWDGRRLPGVWLTARAIDTAVPRARQYGTATVVIRRSHHIACLGAFLTRATDQGLMILLASSDPSVASVAPYGGITPVFTPDPIAVGIPTAGEPILIDTSASITTNGMSARLRKEGRRFPHAWLLDAAGNPTDDPKRAVPGAGRHHPAHRRPRPRAQGLRPGPDGRSADHGPGRLRPGRARRGLGCVGVRPAARPRRLRRWRRLPPPDRLDRRRLPRLAPPGPASSGCACRAKPPSPAARHALAEGVELYPGIMARLQECADRLGVAA